MATTASLTVPKIIVGGPIFDSAQAALVVRSPKLVATGMATGATAVLKVPALKLTATQDGGVVVRLPKLKLTAAAQNWTVLLKLPRPIVSITGPVGMSLKVPPPKMFAVSFGPGDVATPENPYAQQFPGWAINYETHAPSRYEKMPVNSMCRFNGKTYISCAAGIYEVGSTADAGQPIHASATLPQSNFGNTHNKRVPAVYVGMRTNGQILLKVIANNQSARYYALTKVSGAVHGARATIGKGLVGQYWQYRLENVAGASFEFDAMEFKPSILKRHGV